MPIYEYEREDGSVFEVMQKISEDALETCPNTGQKVRRLISQNAFHLKGGGWYKTDYGSSGSSSTTKSGTTESTDAGSSSAASSESSSSAGSNSDSSSSTGAASCSTGCGCH